MKSPKGIDALSIAGNELRSGGAYPPLGFKPVWNAELGNGDYFGFYWPYGQEDQDPVVCDMLHDEAGLQVSFSSVPIFLEWLKLNDWVRGDNIVDDPRLVSTRFQVARRLIKEQPHEAITELEAICSDFPECSEYWSALAGQLRRIGDMERAVDAAIRSFASNWVFGMPPNGVVSLLQIGKNIQTLANDPLVARSHEIEMRFGGTKENRIYGVINDCIASYLSSENPLLGLLLNQNYGYMMMSETLSFQERHDFDVNEWLKQHSQLCLVHLGDNRQSIDD